MRDPARIDQVLLAIREIWVRHPELRLGQLIDSAVGPDIYRVEDMELIHRMEKLARRLRKDRKKGADERPGGVTDNTGLS